MQTSSPMQRHGHKEIDILKKCACLQRGVRKPDHYRIKLGFVILECLHHILQRLRISAGPCNPVKMNLLTAATQANTFTSNIRTYVPAATPAVISRTYRNQPFPAIIAQAASSFNTVPAAIDTLGRPKQLPQAANGIANGSREPIRCPIGCGYHLFRDYSVRRAFYQRRLPRPW